MKGGLRSGANRKSTIGNPSRFSNDHRRQVVGLGLTFGECVYAPAQAGDAAAPGPDGAPAGEAPADEEKKDDGGEDVIDAEYEVKE